MKKNNHVLLLFSMLCLSIPLWIGCNNEMDEVKKPNSPMTGNYDGEPISIKAIVSDFGDFNDGAATRSGTGKQEFVEPLNKNEDSGFDIRTTIENIASTQTRSSRATLQNVRFRILAYRNDTVSIANYAGQGDYVTDETGKATAVTNKELMLPAGKYLFVCYSYGGNAELAEFVGTNSLALSVLHSQDFMTYTKKSIVVDGGSTGEFVISGIEFVRQCSKLQLAVTADGFSDNIISSCAVTISNMNDQTVSWVVGSEDIVGLSLSGTSGQVDMTWSTLDADSISSDIFIVLPASTRDLHVLFKSLTVDGKDLKNATVTIPQQALDPRKQYLITLNLERNYIKVGDYKWAKGNLYKDGNSYGFESSQHAYRPELNGGSYFGWNTLSEMDGDFNNGNYHYDNDPCSKITPQGTWMTPARAEVMNLRDYNFNWSEDLKGAYFGTAPDTLFLPGCGARARNNDTTAGVMDNDGTYAFYLLRDDLPRNMQAFSILKGSANIMQNLNRRFGLPVRCRKTN